MKKTFVLRYLVIAIAGALILSFVSMLCLNQIAELGAREHRRNFMRSIAASVESHGLDEHALDLFMRRGPPPPPPGAGFGFGPRPGAGPSSGPGMGPRPGDGPPPGGGPFGRPSLWIVDENGSVLSSTSERPLPREWSQLVKPSTVHEFESDEDFFKIKPGVFIMRLDTAKTAYLLLEEDRRHWNGPLFMTQLTLVFITVCVALLFALTITFLYLQKKSNEAKAVLLKLEKGDLKARFEIKSFDEFGSLLLDFNRMAEQIEKLVGRVQETEKTRRNLLQELGHDLRTPLTGLNTSFETLKNYWPQMQESQKNEMLTVMGDEIAYLSDLLEKLMTISNLEEPRYRSDADLLDLKALISQEVTSREQNKIHMPHLRWEFTHSLTNEDPRFVGDPHLILRMIRNAMDNAARFAKSTIALRLTESEGELCLTIEDDGPGFTPESLESFGRRLEHRMRKNAAEKTFSLGLGSVIMKTIAELHGGKVHVANTSRLRPGSARVEITLPKAV